MGWAEHVACVGEKGDACRVLVEKHEGRRPLVRWEDDFQMNLEKIDWEDTDWIRKIWNSSRGQAIVSTVMNLCFIKCEEFLD